jgi:polyhydroxyalkanoate synthase
MTTKPTLAADGPSGQDPLVSTSGGEAIGTSSLGESVVSLLGALRRTQTIAREVARLGEETVRIVAGKSEIAAPKGDRRFTDSAWTTNPAFRRLMQTYLAATDTLDRIVDDYGTSTDAHKAQLARFGATIVASAIAPTNYLPTNPAAIKRASDTRGLSLLHGVRNLVSDLRHNGGMPSMVQDGVFEVGKNLAVTPGAVVVRDEVAELVQYRPSTEKVYDRPVLVVPPPIGRYYFLDLAPGRSFVEYAVGCGLQTFLLSWRNPTAEHGEWDLDTYASRVSEAIDTVREITGHHDVNLIGFCAGGIIATTLLNHLSAIEDDRVHSVSYAVTLLDFAEPAPIAAFSGAGLLAFARNRSRRKGIITSRQMGSAFVWMRPDDLVFNYVVNNYLMGEKPPAFDILAWNADGTNLPGALHCQFLDIFQDNLLVRSEAMSVLGTLLQLDRIKVPTFVTGAIADHLTPWKGCYRTTQLLGGDNTFVLSYSGHIASLVNPSDNPKAHHWAGGDPGPDPDEWLANANRVQGTWWEAWADWIADKSGEHRAPADALGSDLNPPLESAPGLYVRDLTAQ